MVYFCIPGFSNWRQAQAPLCGLPAWWGISLRRAAGLARRQLSNADGRVSRSMGTELQARPGALLPGSGSAAAMADLPTLQRNALCKLFDRPDFTPREVAELGYSRLQKVSGIGPKGLEVICLWAARHGVELRPDSAARSNRMAHRVERAIRLLQRLGYEVRQPLERVVQESLAANKGKLNKQISNQSFRP